MHLFSPQHKLHFETFKDGPERKKMGTKDLYSQSKAGDVIIAKEFARRYGDQGIISISLNPGEIHFKFEWNLVIEMHVYQATLIPTSPDMYQGLCRS